MGEWKARTPYLSEPEKARLLARPDRAFPAHIWKALDYQPNLWAIAHVHSSAARFNAFATSRQCGKTTALIYDLFDAMFEAPREDDQTHFRDEKGKITKPNPNYVGVISDTYEHAELSVLPFISEMQRLFGDSFFSVNLNKHVLRVPKTGAELHWFSAENPRAAQGHTFSRVYIDESQNVIDDFWVNLRPALGARMAKVFAFGTPDPVLESSWFEGLYLNGLQDEEPDPNYYAYSVPCTLNKWLPVEDVKEALHTMSEREFRMKYLGQWVSHDGVVFNDPEACIEPDVLITDVKVRGGEVSMPLKRPIPKGSYSMGLDLAKHDDFTVAYVIDTHSKAIVARFRVNHLPYTDIATAVEALYRKFKCRRIRMDTTGLGEPVADMLRKRDLRVVDYTFTNKTKERLVSTLAREIEHKRLAIPKEDTQLLRELKAFTRTVSKAGNVMYAAPVNYHDDCVFALALAVMEAQTGGKARISSYVFGEKVAA